MFSSLFLQKRLPARSSPDILTHLRFWHQHTEKLHEIQVSANGLSMSVSDPSGLIYKNLQQKLSWSPFSLGLVEGEVFILCALQTLCFAADECPSAEP
jgi:hypothetical protein